MRKDNERSAILYLQALSLIRIMRRLNVPRLVVNLNLRWLEKAAGQIIPTNKQCIKLSGLIKFQYAGWYVWVAHSQ